MTKLIPLFALAACTSTPPAVPPSPRFVNAPAVEVSDDRMPTRSPRPKEKTDFGYFEDSFTRPVERTFELRKERRAEGVNALDEVPNSTWFTNRIGVRDMSLDELRRGPIKIENPDHHTPWTIHTRLTGDTAGFIATDARGERFLIKFDRLGYPEIETANQVIGGRFLWACGYNVPEDYISHVHAKDFVIGRDAVTRDEIGRKRRFTEADLQSLIAHIVIEPDGSIRAMASRILPGTLLGGQMMEGVRPDDPNDRIDHEHRRDLRGTRPIYAWLDHVDAKRDNTMDTWVSDPAQPDRHYVVHYFLDFGKTLGGMEIIGHDPRPGFEYSTDPAFMSQSFATLGLVPQPFHERHAPPYRGLGLFDANSYRPGAWRPLTESYVPLLRADRFDWFWGAKIAMRFTPEQIRAIVEVGELTDPRAVDYLVKTLVTRQQMTALYAFSRVSPLDRFSIDQDHQVCFDDLIARYELSSKPAIYAVNLYDRSGHALGPVQPQSGTAAHTCTRPLPVARNGNAYAIVKITTYREGRAQPVFVHVGRAPLTRDWHVIGVWRE